MDSILSRALSKGGHLRLLLTVSAMLLVTWSLVVPIFEAPDEPHHWLYAQYVHDHQRLPYYDSQLVEGNQAPLYYLLISPFSGKTVRREARAWITSGKFQFPCQPRFFRDCPSDLKNFWPIRWARFVTAALSLLTVLFTYWAGYEATGRPYTGFLAGALVAFLPEFTFRGTNVSNDAMVATTSAAAIYGLLLLVRRGFSWKRGLFVSLAVALAFLSKISAIIFLPVLAGVLLSEQGSWLIKVKRLAVMLLVPVCAAPWLIRNQLLYGDVLANKAMLTAASILVDKKTISSPYFLNPFPRMLAESFVGVFGWMNVYLPVWIYIALAMLSLIAILGFFRAVFAQTIDRRVACVLVSLPLLAVASVVQLNLTFTQPQGRYLFPALSTFMLLLAVGLEALPWWRRNWTLGTVALMIGINFYALLAVELRTYWIAPPISPSTTIDTSLGLGTPVGPIPAGGEFGQTFRPQGPGLSAVTIQIATYSKKIPSGFVKLHLRSGPQDRADLASVSVPASQITDWESVTLSFPPIQDSKGRSFYLAIDTQGIPAGYPVTVSASNNDVYGNGQFFINRQSTPRDMSFRLIDTVPCNDCGPL